MLLPFLKEFKLYNVVMMETSEAVATHDRLVKENKQYEKICKVCEHV